MHYLSYLTLPELTPILALIAGMLGSFWALQKQQMTQASKEREADREERKAMAIAFTRMADATEQGSREAKERNGHLGEQNIQLAEMLKSNKHEIIRAVNCIREQHVDRQIVSTEIVGHKE